MDNKNLPAYPQPVANNMSSEIYATSMLDASLGGMTKREMIAAMCLQGLLSGKVVGSSNPNSVFDLYPEWAVQYADKLLSHLENSQK